MATSQRLKTLTTLYYVLILGGEKMEIDNKLSSIIGVIETVSEDTTLPRNIRRALTESVEHLKSDEENLVKVGAAVYVIESLTEDINMPPHARTQIWNILTALESILKELRESS